MSDTGLGKYDFILVKKDSGEKKTHCLKKKKKNAVFVFYYNFTLLFLPLNEPIVCRTDNNTHHQGHTHTTWQPLKPLVNPLPK